MVAALELVRSPAPSPPTFPWPGLDGLLDCTSDPDAIRSHRLQLLAARRWRATGRPVPPDFERLERIAVAVELAAPVVLGRVRAVVEGPIVVHKGPLAARAYPDPSLRGFDDLDLLVRDPVAAQRALVASGFTEVGDPSRYVGIHHLRPLSAPGIPLRVEIHRAPKWPEGLQAPSLAELLEGAVPYGGLDDVWAVSPARHTLVLAAHAWAHVPLRRLHDLFDVAVVAAAADPGDVARQARDWEIDRVWDVTARAAHALFGSGRPTVPLRTWAAHLAELRERTVLESHLERLLSTFWALPPRAAARESGLRLVDALRPAAGEGWDDKLDRTRAALRNARRPQSQHDRSLGARAHRPARRSGAPPRDADDVEI